MGYEYSKIIDDLLTWYEAEKRTLSWRSNPEPYYVWLSEIMLQQTRVEAVKAYFARFIESLPQISDLAHAEEDKLMKLWEGLGYYSRVRNLKKAAVIVEEDYAGHLPKDYEALLTLPGIGSYTAGAIASIAYGIPVPAVDGNVLRVTKRLAGSYDDITQASVKKQLEKDLKEVLEQHCGENPGAFNQALMELGAIVCIPNGKPLCEKCPVKNYCKAKQDNLWMKIPVKPSKKPRRIEEKTVFVLEYQSKYALHRRGEKGLLAKLWEYPNVDGKMSIPRVEELLERNGIEDYEMELLGEAKHIFSHVEWHMLGYHIKTHKKEKEDWLESPLMQELVWVSKQEIETTYALPSAFEAFRN